MVKSFDNVPENNRQETLSSSSSSSFSSSSSDPTVELAKSLKAFIQENNGGNDGWVSSMRIVARFRGAVDAKQAAVFKCLTRRLCLFKKVHGIGFYKLKDDV